VTWADGLDEKGRPKRRADAEPSQEGTRVYPAVQGATNWYSPSFSPKTGLFYLSAWEYSSVYHKGDPTYTRGNRYIGSLPQGIWPDPMNDEVPGYGAVLAIDPQTGEKEWEFTLSRATESGLLSTDGDVLFGGSREGYFFALDPHNGKLLWRVSLGGVIANSTITYLVGSKQYVSVASGNSLFTFGLKE
jgi:alcohol dehydrogenase (cytochrome c)